MDELKPIFEGLIQQPIAFVGGFVSGILKLNLSDDPVKTWLEKEGASVSDTSSTTSVSNGNKGPQSITIE
ncbi:MAG: hypothetical protein WAN66_16105 [Limnoraphis robusta]|jgi:hypothetical protein|uniref:Uncharacterized protein n=1 Tax=Limnoraphis robusta CCNP1315 TaxID=3110306 RepID=A0ABU5U4G4_9CYAN|nr:hypothetical protein [Limnoraphis robusta]MCG5061794.1 hypothetical protein [Limnoraphis sp. WC205]MEA5497167.1 hypothetical protein [Limnoraphis robusta BA-68 BA1]MEA5521787.1 hypothetical protein [Limnoraphis robusta CCNP1315]MEA5537694.1 hypothetical protein [Limnoraphis robusta Tam1]MEA5546117.1 hypothetical protein [Limnoraphis robusta CCNP1324]